jgi:hypothetical protein
MSSQANRVPGGAPDSPPLSSIIATNYRIGVPLAPTAQNPHYGRVTRLHDALDPSTGRADLRRIGQRAEARPTCSLEESMSELIPKRPSLAIPMSDSESTTAQVKRIVLTVHLSKTKLARGRRIEVPAR